MVCTSTVCLVGGGHYFADDQAGWFIRNGSKRRDEVDTSCDIRLIIFRWGRPNDLHGFNLNTYH